LRLLLLCLLIAGPSPAQTQRLRVRTARGETLDWPLEHYVAGVLAGESSVFQSAEALKAMAVAARTYAVRMRGRHAAEGYDFCTTTHCQRVDAAAITARLEGVAAETAGELLWYQGKPAFTPYTRDCGGRAANAASIWPDMAAPYLRSHDDPYCARAGPAAWEWRGDPRQILDALARSGLRAPRVLEEIGIVERTDSGRARTLLLAGGGESVPLSASSFRFAMGREIGWNTVRSDRYEVQRAGAQMVFRGLGSGHGAGLCQHGADRMGAEGRSYGEILAFYYPGTATGATARGIPWQRLGGESATLMTTNPRQDGSVLELAERLLRAISRRTNWPAPERVEIRVYPDLDTFRNATGEPGWVAAHTVGRRIDLQPVAVLRSRSALEPVLRHELLHILVESQASADLPLWFREGVVEFLANPPRASGPERIPAEADLRQTTDQARARRAYDDAARMVAGLAGRYGEATVLEWVKRGVPADVTKTNAIQPATKSR
jgi:stage II sporulation protein D